LHHKSHRQDVDLSLKVLHRGSSAATAIASTRAGSTAIVFIIVVVVVVVRQAELLHVDDLDGPPLACVAHYCGSIAFMTIVNVPCLSLCAMSYLVSMLVSSFGMRCQ
jgi:hypothetical protein